MFSIDKIYMNILEKDGDIALISFGFEDSEFINLDEEEYALDNKYFIKAISGNGYPSIESFMNTFDKYNDKDTLYNISDFIKSLNLKYIIINYIDHYKVLQSLLIFIKIFKKLDIQCTVILAKPAKWQGKRMESNFNKVVEYLELDEEIIVTSEDIDDSCSGMKEYFKEMNWSTYQMALKEYKNRMILNDNNILYKNIDFFDDDKKTIVASKTSNNDKDYEIDYYNNWAADNL